ncbi:hypothetical protein CPB83DRAFT_904397 [Crepidotus variabilis]|uniref:F-box domain-containing protein n=1 Tax=Crepidotus variabilis TaxID=179855 RepID=A0A9P6JSA9_9AGAR|nr:hypothetical protein CPB83DRAFT_904397 [Crepidotus variabilis]
MSQLSSNVPCTKSLPTLPDELWAYIGGFLLKPDLAKSYSISPIFFDLWMKKVFQDVKICSLRDLNTLRTLCTMTPLATRYVTKLTLCPQFFPLEEAATSSSYQKSQSQTIYLSEKLTNASSTQEIPTITAVQILLTKTAQMTNLKTLVIKCRTPDDAKLFGNIVIFLDAIKVHANRLENLEINVPTEFLEEVLAAMPCWATLRSISLGFEGAIKRNRGKAAWKKAALFINLYSATLHRLVIFAASVNNDPIPLFSGLEHLPNLTEISLSLSAEYFTPQHRGSGLLETFLKAHSEQILDLELRSAGRFRHEESSHPLLLHHPLFIIDFPSLTCLRFVLNDKYHNPTQLSTEPPIADLLCKNLTQYRGRLQQLCITGRTLSFSEVKALASSLALDDSENNSHLTYLDVRIQSFDADVLTVLARAFPTLDDLCLGHPYLCNTVPTSDAILPARCNTFVDSMSNCDPALSQWKLRHLHIYLREFQAWEQVKEALLSALPNLATINGHSDDRTIAENIIPT